MELCKFPCGALPVHGNLNLKSPLYSDTELLKSRLLVWQMKMSFQNLFLFKNKTCFKASVSQRKSSELNSVLPGISVLEKLFFSDAVAFFTVMFNDFQIFLCLFFLRCFLKYTAEETNNKKINPWMIKGFS